MLISHKWLEKYLPELNQIAPETVADMLTNSLAEVERIIHKGKGLANLQIGEITEVNPHPGSQTLHVCTVRVVKNSFTIVCGAPNVAAGQKVVVCLPGGAVYDVKSPDPEAYLSISEREVKGVKSQGMICSAKELGLSENHEGILVVEPELQTGTEVVTMISDIIFEIENKSLSHRPDCFSHEGIARELSAILKIDFVQGQLETPVIPTSQLPIDIDFKVDAKDCPRFTAVGLTDVHIKDSPLWLQARLAAVGMRPINNVVDATNYVMLDKGQPLHAYDYDKIKNHKLIVRYAKAKEKVKTLDDKNHTLESDIMVVAEPGRVEDIAGIMGCEHSQITKGTTNIILEAANFNMYTIRRSSRKLGIRTEASLRFEKGQDPSRTEIGIKSALELMIDLADAEIASDMIDIYPEPVKEKQVVLDIPNVKRFLGIELSKQEIIDSLSRLGLFAANTEKLADTDTNQMQLQQIILTVPTFRTDLNIQQDLLEELARLYGYERLNPTLPERTLEPATLNKVTVMLRHVKQLLAAQGLDELMTYSFVSKELYAQARMAISGCVKIKNPLSPELSHMRNSLIPSLLGKLSQNSRYFAEFGFFEIGRTVLQTYDAEGLPEQPRRVAGLLYSDKTKENFYPVKGIVEQVFESLALEVEFKTPEKTIPLSSLEAFHPVRTAAIYHQGNFIGLVGEAHPETLYNLDLPGRIGMFELNFDYLLAFSPTAKKYTQLSQYQAVERDLSFWVKSTQTYQQVLDEVNGLALPLIKSIKFKDVFASDDKRKSFTITLTIQSNEHTLTDSEINQVVDTVTTHLTKSLSAEFRL